MGRSPEDTIITEFLESLGPWKDFIVIGGGFALFVYKLYLSDPHLENTPVGTRDIDSLIPRKMPVVSDKNIAKYLEGAGFAHVFKNIEMPATESYLKEISGVEVEVEFLTDSSTRKDKNQNVAVAGVIAQPLNYLNLSLQTTLTFQTFSGIPGRVVSPAAWMLHKGLTFVKRKNHSKALKDLYGIWYVASQLGELSEKAVSEL